MAPEDQYRIFSPLIEAAVQDGTRLGLSITCHFVQQMNGTVAVESATGKGSHFRVELPVELATKAEVSALDKARRITGLAPGQPHCRVLIVEDRPENWLLLRRLLLDAGFLVQVAEDGMHGIEIFQSWRPQLVCVDVRLPVMDGLEVTRRIRRLEGGGDVKIIGLTASAHTHHRTEVLAAGMDDLLRQPYRPDEILDYMARHLGVRYLHSGEDFPITPELSPGVLATLPEDLRLELTEAVVSLETARVAELIDRVSALNQELGFLLAQCAARFAYTDIFRALAGEESQRTGAAHAN
jgi:CheY-like chemotaxis protein